ncbi:hypothetical protein ACN28E_04335 [Archangium lansingense]
MLTIRREQMRVFQDHLWESFLADIVVRARAELPESCIDRSDEELLALLRAPLRQAAAQGIILTADVTRYGLWILRRGQAPNPGGDDPVSRVLNDPHLMGTAKLDALERVGAA